MGRFHFLSASTCWGDWVETVERDSEAACDVMGTEAHDKSVAACTPLTGHLWFSWIGLWKFDENAELRRCCLF